MTRCTPENVQSIIDWDCSITDINPFIETASVLVTDLCENPQGVVKSEATVVYDAQRLKLIEMWLAAHFIAIRDPRYVSETIGRASATFQQQVGLNLSLTPYGQQAMFLDLNGGLAYVNEHISKGKRARVGILHLGSKKVRYPGWPKRFFGIFGSD